MGRKIVIVGDSGIGKSSLMQRFVNGGFLAQQYAATIAVEMEIKKVTLDGEEVFLQLCDTAGSPAYKNLATGRYLKGAHTVMLCCDLTKPSSFSDMINWVEAIKNGLETQAANTRIMVVGTKADVSIADENGFSTAVRRNKDVFEGMVFDGTPYITSAKSGAGVKEVFLAAATAHPVTNKLEDTVVDVELEETSTVGFSSPVGTGYERLRKQQKTLEDQATLLGDDAQVVAPSSRKCCCIIS